MERAELLQLLSPEGLRLLDSLAPYQSQADIVRSVTELRRAGHSAGLVAAVLSQSKLRARAAAKFGDFATQLLYTEAGLEQATRLSVAALHAGRFRAAGIERVADLGCGIGADALAMAAIGLRLTAVERDEVTAAIASYNLAAFPNVTVVHADATTVSLDEVDGVFLDPARRTAGHGATTRITDPGEYSPSLSFALELAARMPAGIKLGPGLERELIPADVEAQWVSVNADVVEMGLWSGPLARAGILRSALVIGSAGTYELTAAGDTEDAEVGELGPWLYEPDGAVIRARLIGNLARSLDARMVSAGIAWMTSGSAVDTPFAQRFAVEEVFPLDVGLLRKELRARGIGVLEIKKRGVDIDPAAFRKKLSLSGANSATLILTRIAGIRKAVLARRPEA